MTEHLRAALSDDQDTPPGVDVRAVRSRAARIRRGRWAVGGVATLTAVAIVVPVTLLGPDPAPSTAVAAPSAPVGAPPARIEATCPDAIPAPGPFAPGDGKPLVAFEPTGGLLCGYVPEGAAEVGPLGAVTRLSVEQARTLAARINAGPPPGPAILCTSDAGTPYMLALTGSDRTVTLRVDPGGCGQVGDGTRSVLVAKDPAFRRALDSLPTSAGCPPTLTDQRAVLTGPAGGELLPTDTTRLLLCGYREGVRTGNMPTGVDAVVSTRDTGKYVTELNASPPADSRCTREAGAPVVLVTAVTATATKRLVGEVGNCRALTDGTRSVRNEALVEALSDLTRR